LNRAAVRVFEADAVIAHALILFVAPLLLAAAAGWDLASFTIPNFLTLTLGVAFVAFALSSGMGPTDVGAHFLAGGAGLALGFALFAFRLIGGGDAKLFAAIALWFGFRDFLEFALVASLFGGGLALALLSLRRFPMPAALAGQNWLARLHDDKSGIPYGVALAAGALVVLPHAEIFRLAAG
jgi:prepilin peptidase CpaA